ncbi:MAG: hypothetical protein HC802_22415 [Caldilineaceae bacterium]|nr:hypothetical protein [Caldilineaceae bacterium]
MSSTSSADKFLAAAAEFPDDALPDQRVYEHPLVQRYATKEMSFIWSPAMKFTTWRKLWTALATAEQELGIDITDEQLEEMRMHLFNVDFELAAKKEAEFRHDVMGHVHAFDFFEGVPQRISYDNLKTAVKEILEGRHRVEQEAFFHFRGTYLFDSHFCTPGAGNEKGQVEHSVGFGRRNFMVPLPQVSNYEDLNAYLLHKCQEDDARIVSGQPATIGQRWQQEKSLLRPLPTYPYDCCRTVTASLNRYSQVQVETNRYSVPVDDAQPQLTAKLYPFTVEIYRSDRTEPIASHPRCYDRQQELLDPLHYLPLIRQRLGMVNGAGPLRRWRTQWPAVYDELLDYLRQKWPDGRGVREFVNILYLHREYSETAIATAVTAALSHRCAHLDGVRLWLTQQQRQEPSLPALTLAEKPQLQGVGEQPVRAEAYDVLWGGGK